jgi:hypothetical protein
MARRSRFLFLESQYIDKPISHLKYSRKNILPDAQDYNFLVPFFIFKLTTCSNIEHTITSSTFIDTIPTTSQLQLQITHPTFMPTRPSSPSHDIANNDEPLLYTVENFNPLPDSVNISEDLHPFISCVLIYNKKKTTYYPLVPLNGLNLSKNKQKGQNIDQIDRKQNQLA